MICKKCGNEFFENYGKYVSGDFCSRSCANSKNWSEEHKDKLSIILKKSTNSRKINKDYICKSCGKLYQKYNRYQKCKNCRRKVLHSIEVDSLYQASTRTISKILKRANKGCSICGWNEATCDIHHVIQKKYGGKDTHDNLIIICPNCHRKRHVLKDKFKTNEELLKLTLDKTFKDWKQYYHISN